ncbi:LysR family transcriptional regulator [Bradyrhizobium sp. STM 3562]|uniref:LysR family transcriptional regulator n=1 Tax=Bradyrhizobium sp. STM 3562 TaxID=578924 RepID=UPI00389074A7
MRIHAAALLYFDAVRRAGSIREAARRLNVASSAVNRQILKLEGEVGAPLFDRFPDGIRLTSAGEALARHVLVVLQDLDRARSDIEGLKGARIGHIAIAAVDGVCGALLPDVLRRLRERTPRVTVSADSMGSLAIPRAVLEGEVDIGIAFALPRHAELRQVAVGRFRLGAIMAPDHPLASRPKVTLSMCFDHPVIMPMGELSIGQLLAPALARLPRNVQPIIRSSSIELMRELAERSIGVSFQTRVGLERHIAEGRLVHVPLDAGGPIWSDLGVYVRAGRALPATLDLALHILSEEVRRREAAEQAKGS